MILTAAQLTPSGRPVLQQGEVEVSLLDKVDMEFQPVGGLSGQQTAAYKNGYAILTTRRLIWVDAGPAEGATAAASSSGGGGGGGGGGAPGGGGGGGVRAAALPLSAVVVCHKRVQYSLKGAKVRLVLEVYTDRQRQPVPASGFHTNIDLLALRCRGPAPDTFKTQLEEQARQAVAADAAAAGAAAGGASASSAANLASAASSTASAAGGGGGGGKLDVHMSPLRAGLQARLSPQPLEGSPALAAAAAAAAAPIQSPSVSVVRPDPSLLQSMVDMGFPRNRAARSLVATRNQGAQEAIDYLLAFGDQPGMDEPLDDTQPPPRQGQGQGMGMGMGPPPPPVLAPAWAAPPSPAHAAAPSSGLYPAVLPASGPLVGSVPQSGGATAAAGGGGGSYPLVPQSPAAALLTQYGPGSYGGAGGGPASPAAFGGGGPASPLVTSLQQMSLRPYPHQYGSAPDLTAAASCGAPPPASVTVGGAGPGPGGAGLAARTIGVAGLVKREQQKTAESGRAVEQAFRDLSALMSSAASMVALAEKFRGVLAAGAGAEQGAGVGADDPLLLDLETQQQLIALGISSPVTRESAGARYHIELSRQLADFLAGPLQRCAGLISMPDVYCLFNRARGTELVSPDDLLQAAKLFGRAGVVGLRLRPLSSGVLVIQGPQHSEEQVCAKIAQLTTSPPPPPGQAPSGPSPPLGPGLTSGDVALALGGISTAIAAEHLLTAEARGVVVRDDGPEGLRFYRNFFAQDRLVPAAAAVVRVVS